MICSSSTYLLNVNYTAGNLLGPGTSDDAARRCRKLLGYSLVGNE